MNPGDSPPVQLWFTVQARKCRPALMTGPVSMDVRARAMAWRDAGRAVRTAANVPLHQKGVLKPGIGRQAVGLPFLHPARVL